MSEKDFAFRVLWVFFGEGGLDNSQTKSWFPHRKIRLKKQSCKGSQRGRNIKCFLTIQLSFLMLKKFLHIFCTPNHIIHSLKVRKKDSPVKKIVVHPLVYHGPYPSGHSQTVLLVRLHSFFFILPSLHNWQSSQLSVDSRALNMPFEHFLHCASGVRSPDWL